MNPQTFAEALEEAERKRLAEQATAVAGQAQQAGAQYQQAAQEPTPGLGLAESFIPALLGNIASVISQNPAYAQQGQERIQQSRADLLKSRADNLQALRDVWGQKAQAAQRAGDLEAEGTARQKQEQISKTYELVKLNLDHASKADLQGQAQKAAVGLERERQRGDIATVRARGEEDRKTQAARGGLVGGVDDAEALAWADKLATGEATISNVPQGVNGAFRTKVIRLGAERGDIIMPKKARDTIQELSAARAIVIQLGELSQKIPRGQGLGRLAVGAKSKAAGFAQSAGLGEDVANYQAMAVGMLANLSRATGERGVLTNQDVDRVKKNIPTVDDTEVVSANKLGNLSALFDDLEQRVIKTYSTKLGGTATAKADALKAARTGDTATLRRIIQQNPALNNDPDLLMLVKRRR
jgi:hypothetical protein